MENIIENRRHVDIIFWALPIFHNFFKPTEENQKILDSILFLNKKLTASKTWQANTVLFLQNLKGKWKLRDEQVSFSFKILSHPENLYVPFYILSWVTEKKLKSKTYTM